MIFLLAQIAMVAFVIGYRIFAHEWHVLCLWLITVNFGMIILSRRKIAEDWKYFRGNTRACLHLFWKDWGEPFVIAAILAVMIRTFILGPYKIPTGSMIPTFMIGDRIFVDKVTYHFKDPKRGDIIVFKFPGDEKKDFVKRLVGLPNDDVLIHDGKVVVNGRVLEDPPFSDYYYYNWSSGELGREGQIFEVPEDSFFVLGDNSAHSHDSRAWGFVPRKNLVGKAFLIWWPVTRIKLVK